MSYLEVSHGQILLLVFILVNCFATFFVPVSICAAACIHFCLIFIIFQAWSPSHSLKTLRKKLLDTSADDKITSKPSGDGDALEMGPISSGKKDSNTGQYACDYTIKCVNALVLRCVCIRHIHVCVFGRISGCVYVSMHVFAYLYLPYVFR